MRMDTSTESSSSVHDTRSSLGEGRLPADQNGATSWSGVVAYLMLLSVAVGAFLVIRSLGEGQTLNDAALATSPTSAVRQVKPAIDVVLHVLVSLAAVIGLGYLLGRLLAWCGQPAVIGEVLAGILLGPSLLGAISPAAMHMLIPSASADPGGQVPAALKVIAQLGVILYMFLVGLELNGARVARRASVAVGVSHASIVLPFVLGSWLSLWLYRDFAPSGVSFTSFALFMGVAMAITAFPVLARILTDRGLERTDLGQLALACAAADDVTAWCLLALVVGIAKAELATAWQVLLGAMAFIGAMLLVVRPLVARLLRTLDDDPARPVPAIAISGTFFAVLLAAAGTELIGIHAVFGAFLLGVIIPHDSRIAAKFNEILREPVTALLLPAFFAYTGMRTQIGLVSGTTAWICVVAILLVATLGKFGGTVAAARWEGMSWREAAALGALMNTRGLMELIVLNIGLDLGVISPQLFAMMVIMALVTTATTAPILKWLIPAQRANR